MVGYQDREQKIIINASTKIQGGARGDTTWGFYISNEKGELNGPFTTTSEQHSQIATEVFYQKGEVICEIDSSIRQNGSGGQVREVILSQKNEPSSIKK